MNGLHIPGTPLVVDYWQRKHVPPRALFFLSHLHADHTCGLSSRWPYLIHCTPITARLLLNKFKIQRNLIVELEVGESRILHVDGLSERVSVTVTVLDANHCPGSAMFIFESYFGRILYTGDFRYSREMASLPQLMQSRPIDLLYLDNTYCHPSCIFPSQEVATEEIINYIRENENGVTLIGLHTLGKEDLLVAIAKRLGMWVGVPPERFETLRLIEAENVFTTDVDSCFVRVLPFHIALRTGQRVSIKDDPKTVVILPTCIFIGENAPLATPLHPSIKVVPYSNHSSFPELMEFVGVVKPRSIRPIVRGSSSGKNSGVVATRCDMSVFSHLLEPMPMTGFETPRLISQMFVNMGCRDDKKPRLQSVRKSLEGTSSSGGGNRGGHGGQLRRRKRTGAGVSYLSPSKDKSHDSHMTIEQAQRDNVESHDCQVIQEGKADEMVQVITEREVEQGKETKKENEKQEKDPEEENVNHTNQPSLITQKKVKPHPANPKPHPTVCKPCPATPKPHPPVTKPHPSVSMQLLVTKPNPTFSPSTLQLSVPKPHPPVTKPHSSAPIQPLISKPHPSFPKPHPPAIPQASMLEPQLKNTGPKSVVAPELLALSNAHCSTSVRSCVFYGAEYRSRSRKRSRSLLKLSQLEVDKEGEGDTKERGKRTLPSTLIQPIWMTKMNREWGVIMDSLAAEIADSGGGGDIGREGGGSGEGGERKEFQEGKTETVGVGVVGEVGDKDANDKRRVSNEEEGKRRDGRETEKAAAAAGRKVKQGERNETPTIGNRDIVRTKGAKGVGQTKSKGKEKIGHSTLDALFKKPPSRPSSMATVAKKQASRIIKSTEDDKDQNTIFTCTNSGSIPRPPTPLNISPIHKYTYQSTESHDSHMIPTFSNTDDPNNPFDFVERLLGMA